MHGQRLYKDTFQPDSGIWRSHVPEQDKRARHVTKSVKDWQGHLDGIKNYCGRHFTVTFHEDKEKGYLGVRKVSCNSWDCPHCRPVKALNLKQRTRAVLSRSNWRFATITIDPARVGLDDCLRVLQVNWDRFLKRLRRRNKGIRVIKFVEFHASGYPHIHFISDQYIPQRWLSKNWQDLGGGRISDIRRVKHDKIINYISFYLSGRKQKHAEKDYQYYIYGIRRFEFTRNCYSKPPAKEHTAFMLPSSYESADYKFTEMLNYLKSLGHELQYSKQDEVWYFQ